MRLASVMLLLFNLSIMSAESNKQIELCPHRHVYYMQQQQNKLSNAPKVCPFCDEKILENNRIIHKDAQIMILENINPYFMQGFHWMLLPILHKENPNDFSQSELAQHVQAMRKFSDFFYQESFLQEFVAALGLCAGQSQKHWHNHLKAYQESLQCLSAREEKDEGLIKPKPDLALLQSKWNSWVSNGDLPESSHEIAQDCYYCCAVENINDDKRNFVIKRFKHNIICFPKIPQVAAQVLVMPKVHVHAFKQLSQEAAAENMVLTMALLPKLQQYASSYIANCDGGNWIITGLGAKESVERKKNYHLYTALFPRTDMPFSPGTLVGETCKLDYNPTHLSNYLKNQINELALSLGD